MEAFKAQVLEEGDTIEGEKIDPVLEPQASFVLLDQRTGEIKALGGGRGEKTASLTLNRATDAARQPGSAFKVITAFAPALDTRQATLGSVYYDEPYTVSGHTFRNWWGTSRGYVGYANIRDGIIYSMNIIAVRVLMETVTPETGIEYARNLGITTLTAEDVTASAALGGLTEGVTNLELTGAYAAIANGGVYTKPRFYTRILDRDGNVILGEESETRQVLSSETAFLLTDAMSDSLEPHQLFARPGISINSTSTRARLSRMPAAGKSGTTTSNRDAGSWALRITIRREFGRDMMKIIRSWRIPATINPSGSRSWIGSMRNCRCGTFPSRIPLPRCGSAGNPGNLRFPGCATRIPGAVRSIRNISRREQSLKRCATCISRLPYVRKAVF